MKSIVSFLKLVSIFFIMLPGLAIAQTAIPSSETENPQTGVSTPTTALSPSIFSPQSIINNLNLPISVASQAQITSPMVSQFTSAISGGLSFIESLFSWILGIILHQQGSGFHLPVADKMKATTGACCDGFGFEAVSASAAAVLAANYTNVKPLTHAVRPLNITRLGHTLLYSNVFESVTEPGILFSTLSKQGQSDPSAHLNQVLAESASQSFAFDFFGHHRLGTFKTDSSGKQIPVSFKGRVVTLLYNPDETPAHVTISQNVTSGMRECTYAGNYGGPGDLTASRILRGVNTQPIGPRDVPAHGFSIINQWTGGLAETHSTQISGSVDCSRVQLVEVAVPDDIDLSRMSSAEIKDWISRQKLESLSPTDLPCRESGETKQLNGLDGKPHQVALPNAMGRAGGITDQGAFEATLATFDPSLQTDAAYAINTTPTKLFGQSQMQSVPFSNYYNQVATDPHTRLPGTLSSPYDFGNYGVRQSYVVPISNSGSSTESISVVLGCPSAHEGQKLIPTFHKETPTEAAADHLPSYYLRTEVLISYTGADGQSHQQIVRVNQTAGQISELTRLQLAPGEAQTLRVQMLGTGDSTPNQILAVMKSDRLDVKP
ncbi:MAG: DUF3370 family protein [Candidatus Riflebacteria bacterium]|nr:DUF3370 family protein [Candidatus Riflebacteria bacterium]